MKPNPQAAAQYLRTKVMTSTPEQLQMMLYDGALRFGEQAKIIIRRSRPPGSRAISAGTPRLIEDRLEWRF